MKPAISLAALAALLLPFGGSCKKDGPTNNDNLQPAVVTEPGAATTAPVGHGGAPVGHGGAPAAPTEQGDMAAEGTIAETMNAGGYTYVLVQLKDEQVWVAGPESVVKVGDTVSFSKGMPMDNFRSNALNRTFDVVYFVSALTVNGATAAPMARETTPAAAIPTPATLEVDVKGVKKAEGGKTIAELFAAKAGMGGKPVSVRGVVVKYNSGIMGSNWLHIKDGSGAAGTDDLTLTTQATAKLGDTVLIEGVVALDKDFGAGYKYDLIVENAKVTVE